MCRYYETEDAPSLDSFHLSHTNASTPGHVSGHGKPLTLLPLSPILLPHADCSLQATRITYKNSKSRFIPPSPPFRSSASGHNRVMSEVWRERGGVCGSGGLTWVNWYTAANTSYCISSRCCCARRAAESLSL